MRHDGRACDQLREISIIPEYLKYPAGSALISFGDTKVLCTVQIEEKVPQFLESREKPQGWLTAEYALMPASGLTRNPRAGYGKTSVKGRVHEIQRLIGRAMRCAVDLEKVGERTLLIDCDVVQADGGTRTAAITGAMVALQIAINKLIKGNKLTQNPIINQIAAVSVGLVDGIACLDLDYIEDSRATTDLNIIMTSDGKYVEVQGTGEESVFSKSELDQMLEIGAKGINELLQLQKQTLDKLG